MKKKKDASMKRTIFGKNDLYYHGMVLPGFAFLIVFSYVPMVGLLMAFQDFVPAKGIFGSKWVGLQHFEYMFSLPDSWEIFRNTIVIALGKIIFTMLLAIVFSVVLNEISNVPFKRTVQTIVYLPHFLSWVVLSAVVANLFKLDGVINKLLVQLGFDAINFLGNYKVFPGLLVGTDVWKEFGYSSIVYLAAITGIDPGLHEAAAIDGASWWRRIWHITLPGMRPIIILQAAMGLTRVLSAGFDQIYNLYSPIVYETADVLDTYVYRVGLISRQYSFGTAVGLLRSVVGIILLVTANQLAKKYADRKIF